MKSISLALAMLAAVSMVVTPVAPSYGASLAEQTVRSSPNGTPSAATPKQVRQVIAHHAARGEAAILSKAQMDRLATSHPKLHAKLMAAYQSHTVPSLTPKEKKLVDSMTAANLDAYKAGGDPFIAGAGGVLSTGGWFVVGFLIVLLILILFTPLFGPARAGSR